MTYVIEINVQLYLRQTILSVLSIQKMYYEILFHNIHISPLLRKKNYVRYTAFITELFAKAFHFLSFSVLSSHRNSKYLKKSIEECDSYKR